MEPGVMVVKKYGNRRLYDTQSSAYITLEELAEKIRRGSEVRVVDAKTAEDLTQSTLAQIILESRRASDLLPVPLLVQLIRMGDDSLAEFLGRYMSGALELYQQAKAGAQTIAPYNPFAHLPFTATNAFARLFAGIPLPGAGMAPPPSQVQQPPSPAAAPAPPPPPARSEEMSELRRELEELKAAIKRKK